MKNSINFSIKQILFKHSQKKPTVGFSDFAPYGDPNTSNRSQVASPLRCPGPFWRFIRPSGRRSWRTMGRFATGEWIGNATGISWDILGYHGYGIPRWKCLGEWIISHDHYEIDLKIGNQTVISVIEINWILIMANDGWLGDDEYQTIFSIIRWMKHYY